LGKARIGIQTKDVLILRRHSNYDISASTISVNASTTTFMNLLCGET